MRKLLEKTPKIALKFFSGYGWMDLPTNPASYIDARTHLKKSPQFLRSTSLFIQPEMRSLDHANFIIYAAQSERLSLSLSKLRFNRDNRIRK